MGNADTRLPFFCSFFFVVIWPHKTQKVLKVCFSITVHEVLTLALRVSAQHAEVVNPEVLRSSPAAFGFEVSVIAAWLRITHMLLLFSVSLSFSAFRSKGALGMQGTSKSHTLRQSLQIKLPAPLTGWDRQPRPKV